MGLDSLPLILILLIVTVPAAAWWLGRRFWQQSLRLAPGGTTRYRTIAELVLLAGLWNLLLYGVSAIFFLPWGGGIHSKAPTLYDWQEAHFHHNLFLLVIGGMGGALALLLWQRWHSALCWLAGCVLMVAGLQALRAYSDRVAAIEEQRKVQEASKPFLVNDSLGYARLQTFYDDQGHPAEPSTLPMRRAIPSEKIAQRPTFPGGEQALLLAIRHRVHYPWAAQGQEIPLDITVECIVETTGQLTVLYTSGVPTESEGLGYEQEAVRVVRSLPPFRPGQRAGRPVPVTCSIPVAFRPATAAGSSAH